MGQSVENNLRRGSHHVICHSGFAGKITHRSVRQTRATHRSHSTAMTSAALNANASGWWRCLHPDACHTPLGQRSRQLDINIFQT